MFDGDTRGSPIQSLQLPPEKYLPPLDFEQSAQRQILRYVHLQKTTFQRELLGVAKIPVG